MTALPDSSLGGLLVRRRTFVVWGGFAALMILAWLNRFVQDDAFISLRYAANFVQGHGLLWNAAETPVEGYTNFLWTLLLCIPLSLGIDAVGFMYAAGLACFAGSLIGTYKLGLIALKSESGSLLATGLLGLNYSFSSYATGGLETQLQTLLFIIAALTTLRIIIDRDYRFHRFAAYSLIVSLAILTRPDSGLMLVVSAVFIAATLFRDSSVRPTRKAALIAIAAAPCAIIIGAWLAWKLAYYGNALPNTYYAKVAGAHTVYRGLYYVYAFFDSYWFIPAAFISCIGFWKHRRRLGTCLRFAGIFTLIWLAYIAWAGGDFMEFRFIVPTLPFLMLAFVWAIETVVTQSLMRSIIYALILIGSVHHAVSFRKVRLLTDIERIPQLSGHLDNHSENWNAIGRTLGNDLQFAPDVTIAVTAAGAIPYYSRLRSVDMLGLNDPWVARLEASANPRPGHARRAPLAYLRKTRTHLVVGHPWVVHQSDLAGRSFSESETRQKLIGEFETETLPRDARIVGIPIPNKRYLLALYLTSHVKVDELLESGRWQSFPIHPEEIR